MFKKYSHHKLFLADQDFVIICLFFNIQNKLLFTVTYEGMFQQLSEMYFYHLVDRRLQKRPLICTQLVNITDEVWRRTFPPLSRED